MIKIAYIMTPVEFGGAERVNLTFLKNVNREQFIIHPILLVRPWETNNLFVNALSEMGYHSSTIPVAKKPIHSGRDYIRILRCIFILYRILSQEKFDLVHTHGYFADIIGITVSRLLRIPHIATCHGFISNDNNLKIYNKIDKLSLRFCNKVIAVSEEIKKELLHNGVSESNVATICNAIDNLFYEHDVSDYRIEKRRLLLVDDSHFIIGYVGRLSKEKGIEYFIKACAILKERIKFFKMLIIGDGQERKNLECVSSNLELQENVLFTGFVNDVERWLPAMDVFVLPSFTEGTPLSLLEAMLCGVPVIASDVGGVPDIVKSGTNGILVRPGNVQKIADAICMLYEDEELRLKLAREARVTVQTQYSVEHWIKKIEDEYQRVAASYKRKC